MMRSPWLSGRGGVWSENQTGFRCFNGESLFPTGQRSVESAPGMRKLKESLEEELSTILVQVVGL